MAISIDSQMNGFRGFVCTTPHSFKEHDLVLCLSWLAVIFAWLLRRVLSHPSLVSVGTSQR